MNKPPNQLAEDGQPLAYFSDVLRACHRWLMINDDEYRNEQERKDQWMQIRSIEGVHAKGNKLTSESINQWPLRPKPLSQYQKDKLKSTGEIFS